MGTGKNRNGGYGDTSSDGTNGGLASNPVPAQTTTANVTAKALSATVSAANKVYDGTTTGIDYAFPVGVGGEETLNSTTGSTFDSKDVGTGKTVTVNSIALSDGTNGGLASNYSLGVGQTTTADILASNSPPPISIRRRSLPLPRTNRHNRGRFQCHGSGHQLKLDLPSHKRGRGHR